MAINSTFNAATAAYGNASRLINQAATTLYQKSIKILRTAMGRQS